MQFALSTPIGAALCVIAASPLLLAALARLPVLRGRNALQFTCLVVTGFAAWIVAVTQVPAPLEDIVYGAMLLVAAELFYLEVWALLSRGYTLGVLVTLETAGRPLGDAEIAARYRGGDGIGWIMRHRMGGLVAARLVRESGDRLELTALGTAVALGYRAATALLNLREPAA